jgi:hypothetical protein
MPGGWICSLKLLLCLASAVIHRSESRGTNDHILLSQIRDSPNLEGQVPVFISPRNMVARLYPHALGSPFVASYDSASSSSVVACVFVAAGTCFPSRCLGTPIYSGSTFPACRHNVTFHSKVKGGHSDTRTHTDSKVIS